MRNMVAIQALALVLMLLHVATSKTTNISTPKSTSPSSSVASTANKTISYPEFQHLDVKKALAEVKPKPIMTTSQYQEPLNKPVKNNVYNKSAENEGNLKLKLVHRDKISSHSKSHDHNYLFRARMQRDVKRVSNLISCISGGVAAAAEYKIEDFGSDVVSGMNQGSGEYFVRIGVGSPPRSQYMVIDSGSDIVWVQCKPCTQCYPQTDPLFDPADSATFIGVPCSSSVCEQVENGGCHAGRCKYEVAYGDGSYTKGTLALETLTFGRTMVQNVAIGCGHSNRGMFVGAAGLLGVGGGSMSFVGQLGSQAAGAFSYCLVTRGTDSVGSLEFGREAMPMGATWIPLIQNPRAPSFYYIGLSGIGVGGMKVPIPEDVFQLTETGNGGVVMDTGTAVTRLPTMAYAALRDAFVAQTSNLPRTSGVSIFDTCYNLLGFVSVRIPTISFFFSSGPILTLPANNFLIPVNDEGVFCFAFASSPSGLSIMGNIQQEGIQISFNGANGFVGFGPYVC